jgi:hypothetical protein
MLASISMGRDSRGDREPETGRLERLFRGGVWVFCHHRVRCNCVLWVG